MSKTPCGPVAWVFTPRDLDYLLLNIESSVAVVEDLETTGLAEHAWTHGPVNGGVAARVSLASFTLPQPDREGDPTTWVLPLSHPASPWLGSWRKTLARTAAMIHTARKPLINHNVKYDARWIKAMTGVDLSDQIVWDTQISSHLLDENESTKLKERAPATFGVERWDDYDLTTPGASELVDMWGLGEYAARDTYYTWKLWQEHLKNLFLDDSDEPPMDAEEQLLAKQGRLAHWVAMPTVASLTKIEQNGMLLDRGWAEEQLAIYTEERDRMLGSMAELYTLSETKPSAAPTSNWFKEWSLAAVEAGDLTISGLTPTGVPQWSKAILVRQTRSGSPVAQLVLDQRKASKRAEFLTSWLTWAAKDNRVYPNYKAGYTVTGRLSCESPNMQQVTKGLRPAFIPAPGNVIIDFDYSQIEMRVAAFVSGSKPLIGAFMQGQDTHRLLAARIVSERNVKLANDLGRLTGWGSHALPSVLAGLYAKAGLGQTPTAEEVHAAQLILRLPVGSADVTPEERQAGKAGNFGLLFGMSAGGFREYAENTYEVSFTIDEAEIVREAFFDLWAGIREWHTRVISLAHRQGYVTSPIGRARRLPMIGGYDGWQVSHAERAAINAPVQGFASDLMQTAAADIQGLLPGSTPVPDVKLVGTVHDSIVAEAPEGCWERVARECMERMVHLERPLAALGCTFTVPLVVEATIGTRWSLDDVGALRSDMAVLQNVV